MESAFIFLTLPLFLYSPDDVLTPIVSILQSLAMVCLSLLSGVVHVTQFLITSRAHNLTTGTTAIIVNPVL